MDFGERVGCPQQEGKTPLLCWSVEDITSRKQTEETLRQSEAGLRMWLRKSKEDMEVYAETIDDVCEAYKKLDEVFLTSLKSSCMPWMKDAPG